MSQKSKTVLRSRSRSQSRSPHRQLQQSPKRPIPPKSESQLAKIKKREEFNRENDALIKQGKQLIKIAEKYARVSPNHQLVFTKNDEKRVLTRQEVEEMKKDFFRRLKSEQKTFSEGQKHNRVPIKPASFKAAYTPSKVGPVFVSFLAAEGKKLPNFGELPNEDNTGFLKGTSLLDALPRAREGYFLKNSITLLMYIYASVNDLKSKAQSEGQKNIPDDRMNKVFGKDIALYYQEQGGDKILMSTSGHKMSTYDVVSAKNSKFNPSKIENYYFQSLIAINIFDESDLDTKSAGNLKDASFRQQLLKEYELIERANLLHKKPREDKRRK